MPLKLAAVITTIQPPTHSIIQLMVRLKQLHAELIVIGDKKGPINYELEDVVFFSLERQNQLRYKLAGLTPVNHYSRKNLGYLLAMSHSASCIYETDDDNSPSSTWEPRNIIAKAQKIAGCKWVNAYRMFSDKLIWPRGFPLNLVSSPDTMSYEPNGPLCEFESPIQQGLADGSPDVDAIWRLILDQEICFDKHQSIWLPPQTWCPFNSQSTWWWPTAYPLMYLPSHCSFRMTDIWRSFVAQRCLWEIGCGVTFHAPEVIQKRNLHNLMTDFEEEIPGYLNNEKLVGHLSKLNLKPGIDHVSKNLMLCYETLVSANIFPNDELKLVAAWLEDIAGIMRSK